MKITGFPAVTYDADHNYGEDLKIVPVNGATTVNAQSDLQNVTGLTKSQQRILRRLMTNPGDYIWNPNYGAGLPKFVGKELSDTVLDEIKTAINSQMLQEPTVAKNRPIRITVQTIQSGLYVQIDCFENLSQQPIVLTFEVK
ncbi:MAG TPA: hypothetical protein PLF59_08215 [Cyclobacteriaceae bacterium]|nr:hypothetical protein [Cyclobacteriaceae bacterium]